MKLIERLAKVAAEEAAKKVPHNPKDVSDAAVYERIARAVAREVLAEAVKIVKSENTCDCRPKKEGDCGFCECYGYSTLDRIESGIRSLVKELE